LEATHWHDLVVAGSDNAQMTPIDPTKSEPEGEKTEDIVARLDDLATADPAQAPPLAESLAEDLTEALDGVGDAAAPAGVEAEPVASRDVGEA
jgi:hypothetical protein